jgi:hypothetical protein
MPKIAFFRSTSSRFSRQRVGKAGCHRSGFLDLRKQQLHHRPQIRMPEIIALPQHGLALLAGQRVGEAVAEVPSRRWHPGEGRSTRS